MAKFDRILSDVEIFELAALGNNLLRADSEGDYLTESGENVSYEDLITLLRNVEQAAITKYKEKLAEQEPVAFVSSESFSSDGTSDIMSKNLKVGTKLYAHPMPSLQQEPVFYISDKVLNNKTGKIDSTVKNALTWSRNKCQSWSVPLYTHPIPCVSNESDKVACVSESKESEDQDLDLLKQALESMIGAAHPAHVTDDFLRNKLIKARDVAFKALENHRLNAKEHYRTANNHVVGNNKMVPEGWQLVPKSATDEMQDAACLTNGTTGDRYKAMLAAAPKYTGEK